MPRARTTEATMPAKTPLTETQSVVLAAASARPDRSVLPITAPGVRGGAVAKVIAGLLRRGLAEERPAEGKPDPDRLHRRDDAGRAILLVASDAAVEILGGVGEADPGDDDAPAPATPGGDAAVLEVEAPTAGAAPAAEAAPATPRAPRAGSKQARLVEMLRDPRGHTVDELAAPLGWERHTVRGAMSGALKKRLGLDVRSERVAGRGTVYWIPAE